MSSQSRLPQELSIADFGYDLPEEKIARYPLEHRDQSKLLVWKSGKIEEGFYAGLAGFLSSRTLLVFNNSRVVEARILFYKKSGGQIEIFCLEPHNTHKSITEAMAQTGQARWTCLIGGASKWKRGQVLEKQVGETRIEVRFVEKRADDFVVEFSWFPAGLSFEHILHQFGSIPLPPYLKRAAETSDTERYQTLYAREAGSVAAPTAGLHFSKSLFLSLEKKGIQSSFCTLHVGVGTFMPVKSEKISDHQMHEEYIEITAEFLETLISKLNDPVIAVGTTSLRTLETLYWLGLQSTRFKNKEMRELNLDQWYPYLNTPDISVKDALDSLLERLNTIPGKKLISKTRLIIIPGYRFQIARGLITNFHQPNSTLLLLVAALIGPDWKNVYAWALDHDYRFLSYGDGCLFLP
jgi:S-adenosylmethionine:tRNA ribosyltransferase-isomerase